MWRNGKYTLFKCRICGSTQYVEVRVKKPSGNWYKTEFYECFHCSALFHDPVLFTRGEPSALNAERMPGGAHGHGPEGSSSNEATPHENTS